MTATHIVDSLSAAQARRIALAAQGFSGARTIGKRRPFDSALERLGVLQIDSVNVFARSHYLPVFSRHGQYDTSALDQHLWDSGEFTEYWAHEAAFIPVGDRPLFAWRMADFADRHHDAVTSLGPEIDRVRRLLSESGPQFVRDLQPPRNTPRTGWWDWSDTKRAVEILFAIGDVASTGRERFERRYGLAADVLPAVALESVPRSEAQRILVEKAARSLGVGTLTDLADYFRLKTAEARPAVADLEEAGVLVPVQVESWVDSRQRPLQAWLHRDASIPARLAPNALLTPFDPVVWFRPRAERLFDFHYRIEIYTPKEKRQYGYYCLPLMIAGRMAGRIDVKADRKTQTLVVQAAWQEPGAPARTPVVAADLLREAAAWQSLGTVVSAGVGNLELPTQFTV